MTFLTIKKPVNGGVRRNEAFPTFPSVFDDFFNGFMSRDYANHVPAVNVIEYEKDFSIDLSAPGYNKEDFKIEIEDGILNISGEHKIENKEETKNYTRKEFSYGSFKRSFNLPENIDEENINAKYENGILKLTLTKKKEAEVKRAKEISIS